MRLKLQPATPADAPEIAALRAAVAEALTARHGPGPWSRGGTVKGILFDMRQAAMYVARRRGKIVATLILATKKPWAIDRSYFTPCHRPIYLLALAVHPVWQGQGLGRCCLAEAQRLAKAAGGDAILLDAYDGAAGAGEFYRKSGFREVGRVIYRQVPLVYFELRL